MPDKENVWAKLGLKNLKHPDRFGQWLGYQIDKVEHGKGWATTSLQIREDHLSPSGRVHGGVVSAFFDFSCGAAVFAVLGEGEICSTVELKVNYLRPVDLGDHLKIEAEVVFRGKRLCVVHARLYRDGQKEPIGISIGTFNVIRM